MSSALVLPHEIESVLIGGDLAKLQPEQRLIYYNSLCESLGLNPLTKPFQYLTLSGKTVLYATKDCTEQLRRIHSVSVRIVAREVTEGCYVVTAQAAMPNGRVDESIGAVPIENIKGEARSNAIMKCETKAKRRVTLSICGMGMLDESEVESIPGAAVPSFGKEAQAEVLQRKLKPVAVQEAEPLQLPPAGETYEAREKKRIEELNQVLDGEPAPKPTQRKRGDISFDALKAFKEIKGMLRELSGQDQLYYDCLKIAHVEHADELSTADGRKVYKTLLQIHQKLKQDSDLRKEIETLGGKLPGDKFYTILGTNGFSDVEDVIVNANGTQTDTLLRELRAAQ